MCAVSSPPFPPEPPASRRHRAVQRVVGDLRRGIPILLHGEAPLVVLAAETAGAPGLGELAALVDGHPALVLAPARRASLTGLAMRDGDGDGRDALVLPVTSLPDPALLRGLIDPTAAPPSLPPFGWQAAPAGSQAALLLVKQARLLPAVIVGPLRPGVDPGDLLEVVADAVREAAATEAATLVRVSEAAVPLAGATDTRLVAFRAADAGIEHVAVVVGAPERQHAPLVRLHSECFTGDVLGSLRCDCGTQLRDAIGRMAAEGAGALLYLAQEGRGIGLASKLRAYALQDGAAGPRLDTLDANRALGWEADERGFAMAAAMLRGLGLPRVRLLTNNPAKLDALRTHGIEVTAREPLRAAPNGVNNDYLLTKAERFGHLLG